MSIGVRAETIVRSPFPNVAVPNVSLTEFVLGDAERFGDKPALIDGPTGRTISYRQLVDMVRRAARGLAARGFGKGDVLCIYSPNVPEYAVGFHAAASLGGTVTTVNPLYTVRELVQQLVDSRASYMLTIPQFMDNARAALAEVGTVRELFVFGEAEGATPFAELLADSAPPPHVEIDPGRDLVALPYSSGTTGTAKGVMLTHTNLVAELTLVESCPDVDFPRESDTLLAFLPFFHIYGIVVFLNHSFWQGATIVCMPRFDLEQFLDMVQKYRVTYLHLVPPVVLALAKHPVVDKYDLSTARRALSAAAPLGQSVADSFMQRLGIPVFQAYGMTEVSGATHVGSCAPDQLMPASGGRVLPNVESVIVEPGSGRWLEPTEQGEVWVRGPLVMQGYLGRLDATAITIDADGWLHTGDIGYYDASGNVFIVDRVKELIKFKGMQVAPAELEGILIAHAAVAEAAVIPSPDEEACEIPKAFVVLKSPASAEELMAFVAERVAPHKKIRKLEVIDAIPKSQSGKILRRILVEREREQLATSKT